MAKKKQTAAKPRSVAAVKKEQASNTEKVTEANKAPEVDASKVAETPKTEEPNKVDNVDTLVEEVVKPSAEPSAESQDPILDESDENSLKKEIDIEEEIDLAKKKVVKAAAKFKKAAASLEKAKQLFEEAETLLKEEESLLNALEEGKPKPFYENEKKRKYRFSKTAPKTMNLDGKNYSQEEIINAADLMDILIDGNSSFVEPIY